jgi:uncharacterized membrane protein (GlpM family)
MKNTRRLAIETGSFIVTMILLLFTHQQKFNDFPNHIHAWTQSDRYALAIGFVNNGGNLVYPETYNLRPQLDKTHSNEIGITGVDLPLPDYIAGTLMRIAGSTSPIYFRLTILLFSMLGLLGIFRLAIAVNLGLIPSLIIIIAAAISPVFHYYQVGFLPSVPALSLAALGYYFYVVYLKSGNKSFRIATFVLFVIAGLIRTPFLIHLIALFSLEGIREFKNPARLKREALLWLIVPVLYLPWFFWKQHLTKEFGALFLNQPAHADSWAELNDQLLTSFQNWRFHFYTKWHYLFGLFVLFASPFLKQQPEYKRWLKQAGALSLLGGLCYSLLMSKQLVHHDYYFLDAGFLPILLCVIGLMPEWNKDRVSSILMLAAGLLFLPAMLKESKQTELVRLSEPYFNRTEVTNENFENGSALLEQLKISKHSKILVLDAYTTNGPLILLKRYGYTVLSTSSENIQSALNIPFDYVVIQDLFLLSDVVRSYPQIAMQLKRIGGNGKISVYQKTLLGSSQTNEELLGLQNSLQLESSFYDSPGINWTSKPDTNLHGRLNGIEFGPTWEQVLEQNSLFGYLVSLSVNVDTLPAGVELVFKRFRNDTTLLAYNFRLSDYLKDESGEQTFYCYFPVASLTQPNERIQIFIYNPNKSNFVLNEFRIKQFLRSNTNLK